MYCNNQSEIPKKELKRYKNTLNEKQMEMLNQKGKKSQEKQIDLQKELFENNQDELIKRKISKKAVKNE